MRIAFVGCGYVADFYVLSLKNHPSLELTGVYDRSAERAEAFGRFHRLRTYRSLPELLEDTRVQLVVNLTNPRSHYEVSRACLEAGKHVYSEKPISTDIAQAKELVALAEKKGLLIASAPCSVLGESAQTLWKALRKNEIGQARLVYAELDDGPIHLTNYRSWRSDSGAPWPWKDEFEVGCTLEHAGYYVTWLTAFFGPARRVTSYASSLVPDKGTDVPLDVHTPDFTVSLIEFRSGVTARLTCSIYAPHDRSLRIIGDGGVLSIDDCWNYGAPVLLAKRTPLRLRAEKYPLAARVLGLGPKRYPHVRKVTFEHKAKGSNPMDFLRGVAEMSDALAQKRPCRLSARYCLHVNELVLAIQEAKPGRPHELETTFDPMEPMPWAV